MAKNMASVAFFKVTWHVKASGHLDHILWIYYVCVLCLKIGHHSLQLFERLPKCLFPVKLQ